jgi:hypothetical protein
MRWILVNTKKSVVESNLRIFVLPQYLAYWGPEGGPTTRKSSKSSTGRGTKAILSDKRAFRSGMRRDSLRGSHEPCLACDIIIPHNPGLKYIKLKLVHTHDSVLKRPCFYGVVGTSLMFCRRLTTTEEAHVSN